MTILHINDNIVQYEHDPKLPISKIEHTPLKYIVNKGSNENEKMWIVSNSNLHIYFTRNMYKGDHLTYSTLKNTYYIHINLYI
jgi:hypothetical protein